MKSLALLMLLAASSAWADPILVRPSDAECRDLTARFRTAYESQYPLYGYARQEAPRIAVELNGVLASVRKRGLPLRPDELHEPSNALLLLAREGAWGSEQARARVAPELEKLRHELETFEGLVREQNEFLRDFRAQEGWMDHLPGMPPPDDEAVRQRDHFLEEANHRRAGIARLEARIPAYDPSRHRVELSDCHWQGGFPGAPGLMACYTIPLSALASTREVTEEQILARHAPTGVSEAEYVATQMHDAGFICPAPSESSVVAQAIESDSRVAPARAPATGPVSAPLRARSRIQAAR